MQIAVLDWIILAIVLLSMALGAWRGLVYEVLSVLGWIAAFVVAQLYAAEVGGMLPGQFKSGGLQYLAGFVATFIATAFAAGLLAWAAKRLIAKTGLRPVDRTLGAMFGLLRAFLILLAFATAVLMTPIKDDPSWTQSRGANILVATLKAIKPILPSQAGQYISTKAPVVRET